MSKGYFEQFQGSAGGPHRPHRPQMCASWILWVVVTDLRETVGSGTDKSHYIIVLAMLKH